MAGNGSAGVPEPGGSSPRRVQASESSVQGHRRGGGSQAGALRSVRAQLLAPIIVAMIGLAVLGTAQTSAATSSARDADRAKTLAITATSTVRFVHELERELAETAALRSRGGQSGVTLVTAQRLRAGAARPASQPDAREA